MRFWQRTVVYKAVSVLRCLWLKAVFPRRFTLHGLGMFGSGGIFVIRPGGSVEFGKRVLIDDRVQIETSGRLVVGRQVCINRYSRLVAHDSITLGDNVTIAQFVTILDHDHAFALDPGTKALKLDGYRTAPIKIGSNVWLGDKCTVLRGVTIGDNVVVGAHTLVNKDVASNCIVAGTPLRVIRQLDGGAVG